MITQKELDAFNKIARSLIRMVDGINGYEEEGFDVSRFWKPEEVETARQVVDILLKEKS